LVSDSEIGPEEIDKKMLVEADRSQPPTFLDEKPRRGKQVPVGKRN